MLYIVEGPDCTGKSSLCAAICRLRKATYIHSSGDPAFHQIMGTYHDTILDSAMKNMDNGQPVVLDRFWPSEYVYGSIFREHISEQAYSFSHILERLREIPTIYIFCSDPGMFARHKEQKDASHPYDEEAYNVICAHYLHLEMEMMSDCPLPKFKEPDAPIMKFDVRHYSIQEHGHVITDFVDAL